MTRVVLIAKNSIYLPVWLAERYFKCVQLDASVEILGSIDKSTRASREAVVRSASPRQSELWRKRRWGARLCLSATTVGSCRTT